MNIYKAIARMLSILYQILVSGGERDTRELEDILSNPQALDTRNIVVKLKSLSNDQPWNHVYKISDDATRDAGRGSYTYFKHMFQEKVYMIENS